MTTPTTDHEPYFETLAWQEESPWDLIGHVCNVCRRPVGDGPCPDHAPTVVPGLVKIVCDKGVHHLWTIASDRYDEPCWACLYHDSRAAT